MKEQKKIAKALRDANLASPLIRNTGHTTFCRFLSFQLKKYCRLFCKSESLSYSNAFEYKLTFAFCNVVLEPIIQFSVHKHAWSPSCTSVFYRKQSSRTWYDWYADLRYYSTMLGQFNIESARPATWGERTSKKNVYLVASHELVFWWCKN